MRISTWSFFASRPGTSGAGTCEGKTARARQERDEDILEEDVAAELDREDEESGSETESESEMEEEEVGARASRSSGSKGKTTAVRRRGRSAKA